MHIHDYYYSMVDYSNACSVLQSHSGFSDIVAVSTHTNKSQPHIVYNKDYTHTHIYIYHLCTHEEIQRPIEMCANMYAWYNVQRTHTQKC